MDHISLGGGIAVFGGAFACWAWVVAWGVGVMRKELHELKTALTGVSAAQNVHIQQTERRLTMLETEFQFIKSSLYRITPHNRDEG